MSFSYKTSSHFGNINYKSRLAANIPKTNPNPLPSVVASDGGHNVTFEFLFNSLFNSMIIFNRVPSNEPFKVRITKQVTASNTFIVNPIFFDDPPPSSSSSQYSISSQSSSTISSSSEVDSSSKQASSENNNNSGSSNVTPQPLVCPGKLEQCGGPSKGQCINGECVCKFPYTTLDCSSQIIIIPEPSFDPVKPNRNTTTDGNLPNGNKITYESLVSVYSLREYNSNNKELINEYKFNTWIFKDI
ncbi:hypothetical protein CYY_010519, partial [Polysphondylium violaceum]